jgi:hypothetical protein
MLQQDYAVVFKKKKYSRVRKITLTSNFASEKLCSKLLGSRFNPTKDQPQ